MFLETKPKCVFNVGVIWLSKFDCICNWLNLWISYLLANCSCGASLNSLSLKLDLFNNNNSTAASGLVCAELGVSIMSLQITLYLPVLTLIDQLVLLPPPQSLLPSVEGKPREYPSLSPIVPSRDKPPKPLCVNFHPFTE